ncbi:MAG: MATE family efflux transporter [Alphaproteobacteria bacterium]
MTHIRDVPAPPLRTTHARVFAIAWPIILANAATPLTGIVDTAVIGRLGEPALLGAIAVGALIFNFLYWGFGFLRMGTTGLTAQAEGAGDELQVRAWMARAAALGAACGLALLILQWPIAQGAFGLLEASSAVESEAGAYLSLRIWGAPAALTVYAAMGWFIGLGQSRKVLALTVFQNGVNAALDILFVAGFGWGVEGVAIGTALAEWSAGLLALALILLTLRERNRRTGPLALPRAELTDPLQLGRMLAVNRDIFIRTLLLISAFAWFTAQGAAAGDVTLAANHVLLQFVAFSAFFLDGFAFAAETLVGRAVGARAPVLLADAVRRSTHLAVAAAALLSLGFWLAGPLFIHELSADDAVRAAAVTFLPWAALQPLAAVWCFQFDGIFIGATRGREMRNAMILSFAFYLAAWKALEGPLGNHGLWLAFVGFFLIRGVTLWAYYPAVRRSADPAAEARGEKQAARGG